ncbi:MAG: tetratricopeptide repeat protein [Bacteroidales bacterium]|nr:tetratricopeptide repeat protein [Bacteroidales bacterium]
MKKVYLILLSLLSLAAVASAQTTEDYQSRYNSLVNRVGYAGVGVDYLIAKWEKADPVDVNHMVARFNYYITRGRKDTVAVSFKPNYRGMEPVLSLQDSLGVRRYYYNVPSFNPEDFAAAVKSVNNAIAHDNNRLDLVILKTDSFVAREGDIPDQSKDLVLELADNTFARNYKWNWMGKESVTEEEVLEEIQRYCFIFYNCDTPQAMEAFRQISEKIVKYNPKNVAFINNIGAYYAYRQDLKKALGYYKKAQKIDPSDNISSMNIKRLEKRLAAGKK